MILLKIGYMELLLKNDTGVQTVLKTLSRAIEVDYSDYTTPPKMAIKGPVRLSVQTVAERGWVFSRESVDDAGVVEPGSDLVPFEGRPPARRPLNGGGKKTIRTLFPRCE